MGYRVARLVAGILAAVLVAICLFFFAHSVFGFTNKSIILDSLTVAGMLCLMWCAQEMHARRGK